MLCDCGNMQNPTLTLIGLIFARLNFAIFAIFCNFREIKTRENVWDCWLAKPNPREIFKITFWVEKPVKTLHLYLKIAIHTIFRLIREIKSARNISNHWLGKLNQKKFAKFNPIKTVSKRLAILVHDQQVILWNPICKMTFSHSYS